MIIKDREKRLTLKEVDYWKKVFDAHLMIGTEVEVMFNKTSTVYPENIEREFRDIDTLRPYARGRNQLETLIESVKSDGSLDNGCEIVTSGRKIYGFMPLFAQYKSIVDTIDPFEPYIHQRMGWHNHLVLQNSGYNCLELRRGVPRVIFDNLMLLCKHYFPALAFMTSTMPYEDAYTRYSQFNLTSCLQNYNSDRDIEYTYDEFEDRYNAINICPLSYNNNEEITTFHIEFRFPDGTIFPVQMASMNILFKALVIKAIEISKYGLFNADVNSTDHLYKFKNAPIEYDDDDMIAYHTRNERLSSMVNDNIIDEIKVLSNELVDLLEKEIKDIDELAFVFLKHFATNPISIMYKDLKTMDYRVVNDALYEMLDENYIYDDPEILPLLEVIETKQIKNVETLTDWCNKASELVSYKEPIEEILKRINKYRRIKFTKNVGVTIE